MPYKSRKPIYGEPLVNYSLKLRQDQIQDLKKFKDSAGLIRGWIDKGLAEELGKGDDPVSISKRITALQGDITRLHDSPEYIRARNIREKGIESYSEIVKVLDAGPSFISFRNRELWLNAGTQSRCIMREASRSYVPGWSTKSLTEYLDDNSVRDENIPIELGRVIVNKMLEVYPAEVKVLEGYEKRVKQLEEAIAALRRKLTEQT